MKKLNYSEGTWFAVPLSGGGYAVGVVARMAPKGRIVCGYFFGPRRKALPDVSELQHLDPGAAIRQLLFGDLGLINGEWPILGMSAGWQRDAWPIPFYVRKDEVVRRAWRVRYSSDDPSKIEREEAVPFDTVGLTDDELYGYGAVKILMTKLLADGIDEIT